MAESRRRRVYPAKVSRAYEKTHRMFTEGDATSLASAMICAYRAGDMDRATELAQELATIDPELARHRLGEPRLAELPEKAGLGSLFRRSEPDGASVPLPQRLAPGSDWLS